jgi:hypothetical protein
MMKFKSWEVFKKAWVKALRDGGYRQGKMRLVDEDDRFCCLGVAANLLVKDGSTKGKWIHDGDWSFGKSVANSSGDVLTYSGSCPKWLETVLEQDCTDPSDFGSVEERLMELNDKGKSFKHIAKWIEKNL